MSDVDEKTLSYVAGLFDGEGCVVLARCDTPAHAKALSPRFWLNISISNTHHGIIEWLHDTFGGWVGEKQPKNPRCAISWHWHISANRACQILQDLLPYLRIKNVEAEIAIAFQTQMARRKHLPRVKGNRMPSLTSLDIAEMEQMRQALTEAKRSYKVYNEYL